MNMPRSNLGKIQSADANPASDRLSITQLDYSGSASVTCGAKSTESQSRRRLAARFGAQRYRALPHGARVNAPLVSEIPVRAGEPCESFDPALRQVAASAANRSGQGQLGAEGQSGAHGPDAGGNREKRFTPWSRWKPGAPVSRAAQGAAGAHNSSSSWGSTGARNQMPARALGGSSSGLGFPARRRPRVSEMPSDGQDGRGEPGFSAGGTFCFGAMRRGKQDTREAPASGREPVQPDVGRRSGPGRKPGSWSSDQPSPHHQHRNSSLTIPWRRCARLFVSPDGASLEARAELGGGGSVCRLHFSQFLLEFAAKRLHSGGCGPWAANPMGQMVHCLPINSPARSGSLGRQALFREVT